MQQKWLDIADEYDREDQVTEVLRLNAQAEEKAAECPITASMVRSIPLLNLQSVERTEFDNLVAGGPCESIFSVFCMLFSCLTLSTLHRDRARGQEAHFKRTSR